MLHIDFAPPKLTTLGQTDSQALIEGFKTLGDKFKPGETLAELKRPLPIVGSTATPQKNDPPTLQVTLGSLTGIDQLYGQLFKAISNYLVANSGAKLSDLSEFIDSYAGVNKVSWTENEGELLFTVEFDANTSTTRDLFVGYKAGREGLEIRPDSNDKITLQSKFDSTFTFGLDRTQLNNPQKAFQFGVSELFVESTGKILEAANVEFPVKLGLLDSVAKKVTADFEAKADISSSPAFASASLEQLNSKPLSELLSVERSGHANLVLPIASEFLGVPTSNVGLFQPDVFAGDPALDFGADDQCLSAWLNYGRELLEGQLRFIDDAMVNLSKSAIFATPVTFSSNGQGASKKLSDIISPIQIWRDLSRRAYDAGGAFAVDSIQGLISALDNPIVTYDKEDCALYIGFNLQKQIDLVDEKLDIDIPLGSLANIKSGSNIAIRGNGTIQMKVGLDLKPLGARLNLGPLTKLSELHDGKNPLAYDVQGQTQSYNVDGQNDLRITLSNGQPFEINFDSLHPATATIQSVIDLIALTVPPSLMEIEINQRLGRLELIDKSNGQANAFKVEGINGSLIGGPNGLGLYGEAGNPDENGLLRITGSALHGESIRDHIFIPTDPLTFRGSLWKPPSPVEIFKLRPTSVS